MPDIEKGDTVQWSTSNGRTSGEVVEIVEEGESVPNSKVNGSPDIDGPAAIIEQADGDKVAHKTDNDTLTKVTSDQSSTKNSQFTNSEVREMFDSQKFEGGKNNGTIVVRKVNSCGPYAYQVITDGGEQHWNYLGKVREGKGRASSGDSSGVGNTVEEAQERQNMSSSDFEEFVNSQTYDEYQTYHDSNDIGDKTLSGIVNRAERVAEEEADEDEGTKVDNYLKRTKKQYSGATSSNGYGPHDLSADAIGLLTWGYKPDDVEFENGEPRPA